LPIFALGAAPLAAGWSVGAAEVFGAGVFGAD
jgi:hypothetical protein